MSDTTARDQAGEDRVERVAERLADHDKDANWYYDELEDGEVFLTWDTMPDDDWTDRGLNTWTKGRDYYRDMARAAIAALPGDTLEGLLWPGAQVLLTSRPDGLWGTTVYDYRDKHHSRDYSATGSTIEAAIRAALAAGEGQGDG